MLKIDEKVAENTFPDKWIKVENFLKICYREQTEFVECENFSIKNNPQKKWTCRSANDSVHVLCFLECAAACPFLEMKNKPCLFFTISRARNPDSCRKSQNCA